MAQEASTELQELGEERFACVALRDIEAHEILSRQDVRGGTWVGVRAGIVEALDLERP